MKKIIRLLLEVFFAVRFFKNPLSYFKERLGYSSTPQFLLHARNGLHFILQTKTTDIRVVNEIWHLGVYDKLLNFIQEGSVVIDIGANIGVFSLRAAFKKAKVRIFSYEPFPKNFEILKANIAANHLEGVISAFNLAISHEKGEKDFFFHAQDSGGGSLYSHGDKQQLQSIKVPAITLSEVFEVNKINQCDFLKIDCEGSEEDIILNCPDDLLKKIKAITIEWHDDLSRSGLDHFTGFLVSKGYKVDFDVVTGTIYASRTPNL